MAARKLRPIAVFTPFCYFRYLWDIFPPRGLKYFEEKTRLSARMSLALIALCAQGQHKHMPAMSQNSRCGTELLAAARQTD